MRVYRYSFNTPRKRSASRKRSSYRLKNADSLSLCKDIAVFTAAIFLTVIVLISSHSFPVASSFKMLDFDSSAGFKLNPHSFFYQFVPGMERERGDTEFFLIDRSYSLNLDNYLQQYPQLLLQGEMIGIESFKDSTFHEVKQEEEMLREEEGEEELSASSPPGDNRDSSEEEKEEELSFLTDEDPKEEEEITSPEEGNGEEVVLEEGTDAPHVLIYHTHTTESFVPESGEAFTENLDQTVVFLGEYLQEKLLQKHDIESLHHKEIFDIPRRYAYKEARPVIEELLHENPAPEVVIDLHRDGISRDATTTTINGENTGKILFVVGSRHEDWHSNLRFALFLHERLEEIAPGISRGVRKQNFNYNQNLHPRSIIVEVGGHENTKEEVKRSIPYLAEAIYKAFNP